MTDDRSLERAARSWLETGPTEAPDHAVDAALLRIQTTPQERDWHVPRRARPMTRTGRLLAGAAAVAVLLVGGALFRLGTGTQVGGSAPSSPAPASHATPTASPYAIPPLAASFRSTRYGYTIGIAADWTVTPGTAPWIGPDNSDPSVDTIHITGTYSFITVTSQAMRPGQTYQAFVQAYHDFSGRCAGGLVSTWDPISIGGLEGLVHPGCNAREAIVLAGSRAYAFILGYDSSPSTTPGSALRAPDDIFEAVLAAIHFDPAAAIDDSPSQSAAPPSPS